MSDVVDDYRAVGVTVVHGCKRLVALLPSRIPDLKLDGGVLIEGNRLGKESGADGGFSVRVKLIL